MQLSKNFHLREFTKSQTASRKGITNVPNKDQIINLAGLCQCVLQPVRDEFGVVTINSGYRCSELNTAIGGSKTSQHMKGQAADIECPAVDNASLAKWIRENCDFDQLILEYHTPDDPHSGWVHVSYRDVGSNRNQFLTIS